MFFRKRPLVFYLSALSFGVGLLFFFFSLQGEKEKGVTELRERKAQSKIGISSLSCDELSKQISVEKDDCEKISDLFYANFSRCNRKLSIEADLIYFSELFIAIGDCFRSKGQVKRAREFYQTGLSQPNWELMGPTSTYLHDVLKARIDSLSRLQAEKCFSSTEDFRNVVSKFVETKSFENLVSYAVTDFSVCIGNHCEDISLNSFVAQFSKYLEASSLKVVRSDDRCVRITGWKGAPYETYYFCHGSDKSCLKWSHIGVD